MHILLIDDDSDSRACVSEFLRELGHTVEECANGLEGLEKAAVGRYPMILSDINMPHMNGLDFLRTLKSQSAGEHSDVVLFTGYGDMESAIAALRAGAYDYLLKPINIEELVVLTERIAEHRALLRDNKILTEQFDEKVQEATAIAQLELKELRKQVWQASGAENIGFFSDAMQEVVAAAYKYASDRSIPLLIEGETGTGKEIVAKLVHFGDRSSMTPFVDINCAALTPSLFESELFGYEAGAFTGSLTRGQKGKFDLAQGGTIFLDEIGEIPLDLQGKLLRVIQEKEFYRVGGLKKIKTDVRIICATNVDLAQRVESGSFRRDLYYRLKVGHIYLPPLRERTADIIPLAGLFLKKFSREKRKRFQTIHEKTTAILQRYSWPGNVRELQNAIEWSVFMYDETELKPEHLRLGRDDTASKGTDQTVINPYHFELPEDGFSLDEFMRRIVDRALVKHNGNKTETAKYLGISRRSLYCRLDEQDA